MKPGDNHELLDTILEDADGRAPSANQLLAGIRGEKRARANRRMIAGTAVSALLVALFVLRSDPPPPKPPVIQSTNATVSAPKESVRSDGADRSPQPETEWKIARVNDRQLLELLADTPVALTHDAAGRARLMMVVSAEE